MAPDCNYDIDALHLDTNGVKTQVDSTLVDSAKSIIAEGMRMSFSRDFGQRKLQKTKNILDLPAGELLQAWSTCTREMLRAKFNFDDEMARGKVAYVCEHWFLEVYRAHEHFRQNMSSGHMTMIPSSANTFHACKRKVC